MSESHKNGPFAQSSFSPSDFYSNNTKDRNPINFLKDTSSLRTSIQIPGTQNNLLTLIVKDLYLYFILYIYIFLRGDRNHILIIFALLALKEGSIKVCVWMNGPLNWLSLLLSLNRNAFAISVESEIMTLFYLLPPSFYTLVTEANTWDNLPEKKCSCVSNVSMSAFYLGLSR